MGAPCSHNHTGAPGEGAHGGGAGGGGGSSASEAVPDGCLPAPSRQNCSCSKGLLSAGYGLGLPVGIFKDGHGLDELI